MRTGKALINGKEYLLCLSTGVIMEIEEKFNSSCDDGLRTIVESGKVSDIFWLLHALMVGGAKYAKIEGIENPEVISLETLAAVTCPDDYGSMLSAVIDAVKVGSETKVETKPTKETTKNSKTTQGV